MDHFDVAIGVIAVVIFVSALAYKIIKSKKSKTTSSSTGGSGGTTRPRNRIE